MYAVKQLYQLIMSIPIALAWLLMGTLLTLTYGVPMFDLFIMNWNNMVNQYGDMQSD
jgi:hypothetical protein